MQRIVVGILLMWFWTGTLLAQVASAPKASDAQQWSEIAFKYGPFAFAILFGFAALWLIRGARQVASSSQSAVKEQARTYWVMAAVATATCIIFAAVGTSYWLKINQSLNFFRGQIKDLAAYEQVGADEFYFRTELKQVWQGEAEPLHNMHFVVIQRRPFALGQLFEVAYFKQGASKRTTLKLAYDGEAYPAYRIEYDEKSGAYELKKIARAAPVRTAHASPTSPFVAYAQTRPQSRPLEPASPRVLRRVGQVLPGIEIGLVNLLQEPRTPVGAKIDAMDRLRGLDLAGLKAYAAMITEREPFALTLIELTRHTDRELASKARILAERSGAEAALSRLMSCPEPRIHAAAEQAIFRLPPDEAQRILKQAPSSARIHSLSTQVRSGEKQMMLTPVGSAEGDRYYVKASWNPTDEGTAGCLTELFNRELMASRSLEEERRLMSGRGERVAYWYTKEWAISMAEKIRDCGARASFPSPAPMK